MTASKEIDHSTPTASDWVKRFLLLLPAQGPVLDIACGSGRNLRLLRQRGYSVVGVDRDLSGVADLFGTGGVKLVEADLEEGALPPLFARTFSGVVVTNYLHRPLLPLLPDLIAPGGLLIYETFAAGNERFGRPRNPDFLLRPGELLEMASGRLRVLAYEDLEVELPKPAMIQRIAARHET